MVFSGQLLDHLPRKQLVDGCEAFQDLRDCVSNGFDFEPDSVGCLGIESIAMNPGSTRARPVPWSPNSGLASVHWWVVEIWPLRGVSIRLARTRAKAS